jgi:hypothetical protein
LLFTIPRVCSTVRDMPEDGLAFLTP